MDEADLIEIWQAGKTCEGCNPDFQFWAYAAAHDAAPRVLPGSHILGQINSLSALGEGVSISAPPELVSTEAAHDGVTPMWMPDEAVAVELDVEVSAEALLGPVSLTFLHSDANGADDVAMAGRLFKFVEVRSSDGSRAEIYTEDVVRDAWIQSFEGDLSSHLTEGLNTVRIGLKAASAGLSGTGYLARFDKRLQVWGVSIRSGAADLAVLETRYTCPDDCVGPDSEDFRGFFAAPPTMNAAAGSDGASGFSTPGEGTVGGVWF